MKKVLAVLAACVLTFSGAFAQVLEDTQVRTVLWTGAGSPFAGDASYYGFTDVLQARTEIQKFTLEGMLNWGLLANYDNHGDVDFFRLGTTNCNPLALHSGLPYSGRDWTNANGWKYDWYGLWRGDNHAQSYNASAGADDFRQKNGASDWINHTVFSAGGFNDCPQNINTLTDSYYVNFIYHFNKNFDVGAGTKLNWSVGPAPSHGAWLWEDKAHNVQGGFSTSYDDRAGAFAITSADMAGTYKYDVFAAGNMPGTADVVGFVPYANRYAKRAVAARFVSDGDIGLEIGAALPNGFDTNDFASNFGLKIAPAEWLSIGAAIEGAFDDGSNFYTGATLGFKNFILDLYFAADSLFTSRDDDEAYGTGVAITFIIPNTKISLRPELGVNFFEYDEYDFAWYTGASLDLPITDKFALNVWGSFAQGSKDKRWKDYDDTEDFDGGHIINVRPMISYKFSEKTTASAYVNVERRKAFDDHTRNAWSTGVFVSHKF